MKKIPLIVVVGPTASGKTSLSIELAKRFDCEIISFDSMQIYNELAISTAKPTMEEMAGIKHHLIDCISVCDEFSVADFCEKAKVCIDEIVSKGKVPLLVGGTGLYIDSLINNIDFSVSNKDDEVRKKVDELENELGLEGLHKLLCKLDPRSAEEIHPNNVKRVKRALEMYYSVGKSKTQQMIDSKKNPSPYNPIYIGINYVNREKLYDRINLRVDKMLENGILNEVDTFYKLPVSKTAVQAIGCKEFKPYFEGNSSLEKCVEKLKQESRRYAKRQITWFKRNKDVNWFYPDEMCLESILDGCYELIKNFLNKELSCDE